jgi:restriction system protein
MNPKEYEEYIGEYFKNKGYDIKVTSFTNDYGVDCFASKGKEKIAVQVKMYGEGIRPVNRKMMMELYGAMHYFDCNKAKLVTNGRILDDAKEVADKLGIEILYVEAVENHNSKTKIDETSFEFIWERYILPLKGKTLTRTNGDTNIIKDVDWSGIKRITSNGNTAKIDIEIFKQVINHLRKNGEISRKEINDDYSGRASSGICLILSQVPFIQYHNSPSKLIWRK